MTLYTTRDHTLEFHVNRVKLSSADSPGNSLKLCIGEGSGLKNFRLPWNRLFRKSNSVFDQTAPILIFDLFFNLTLLLRFQLICIFQGEDDVGLSRMQTVVNSEPSPKSSHDEYKYLPLILLNKTFFVGLVLSGEVSNISTFLFATLHTSSQ